MRRRKANDSIKRTSAPEQDIKPSTEVPTSQTPPIQFPGFTKLHLLLAGVVLSTYIRTLYASIPGGDSGELVAEACKLGHAHPPGYPLFTMMYHVLIQHVLPDSLGTIAWRANLVSAILGTIATVLLSMCTEMLCFLCVPREGMPSRSLVGRASSWASVAAGGMYAFSPLVWLYHVGAEVFALNNFFVTLILFLTAYYATHGGPGYIVSIGAFVCGLALTNQHTVVLLEIPLIAWMLWTQRRRIWQEPILVLDWAWWFFIGLAPYAYLPLTHIHKREPGSWGDSATVKGFIHHLRRGDYGTFQLFSRNDKSVAGPIERTVLYFNDFHSRQAMGHGTIIMLQGLGLLLWETFIGDFARNTNIASSRAPRALRHRQVSHKVSNSPVDSSELRRTFPIVFVFALGFYLIVFHTLSNMPLEEELLYGVHARFWMQPNAILFSLFGLGLCYVTCKLANVMSSLPERFNVALFGTFAVAAVVIQLVRSAPMMDQSNNYYLDGYARALIEPLPENSLLLTNYDQQWTTLRYLQQCEGLRPDVTVMNLSMMTYAWFKVYREHYPHLTFPGSHLTATNSTTYMQGGFSFKEFLDANINSKSCSGGIYTGGRIPFPSDKSYLDAYGMKHMGLLATYRALGEDRNPDTAMSFREWFARSIDIWSNIRKRIDHVPEDKYGAETWEWTVNRDRFEKLAATSADILHEALERKNLLMMALASGYLEECFTNDKPYISASAVKNLGLAYVRMVQSKLEFEEGVSIPNPVLIGKQDTWKNLASHRALLVWSHFLQMPGAKDDSSYNEIVRVVQVLKEASQASQRQPSPKET